jgi:hypothetical protein
MRANQMVATASVLIFGDARKGLFNPDAVDVSGGSMATLL